MVGNILLAIVSACVYAVTGYLKSAGEGFVWTKFVATLLVGGFVGVWLWFLGFEVTQENVALYMTSCAGVVVVVENLIKTISRRFIK